MYCEGDPGCRPIGCTATLESIKMGFHTPILNTIIGESIQLLSKDVRQDLFIRIQNYCKSKDELEYPMCEWCVFKKGKLSCSQCKKSSYCSKECQLSAWRTSHKQNCLLTSVIFNRKKNIE